MSPHVTGISPDGLPPIRLHDLRHTHATLALRAGVHPRVVQERLGHANVSMTSIPTPTSTSRCRQMLPLGCRLWSLASTRDEKFCGQFRDQVAISRPKRRPRKSLTCGDAFPIGGGGGI